MAIGSGLHGSWLWQSRLASINLTVIWVSSGLLTTRSEPSDSPDTVDGKVCADVDTAPSGGTEVRANSRERAFSMR
jgi:hypothetical protein